MQQHNNDEERYHLTPVDIDAIAPMAGAAVAAALREFGTHWAARRMGSAAAAWARVESAVGLGRAAMLGHEAAIAALLGATEQGERV